MDKKLKKGVTQKGVAKKGNFVACTTRATNDYIEANVVVYAVNRFQLPEIKNFFNEKNGIQYNEDLFALQEMIQFVWRSAIRSDPPSLIHVYIPSKRMRNMLNKWLCGQ